MLNNKRLSRLLLLDRPLGTIDLALLITTVLAVIITEQTVLCFHIVFVLLTFGAFFWRFRGFAFRAGFWIPLTTAVVLRAVLIGQTQPDELIEIPLLTLIFVQVFVIAGSRSQVEQTRDDLAHMVVHDMKNLIQGISGYSDLLRLNAKGSLNQGQDELVARISANARSLMDMTTMILDTRRMEEGKLTLQYSPRSVQEVLGEAAEKWRWHAEEKNITMGIESLEADLVVTLDWPLIQRVLDNLISNALKHSPSNTLVTLSSTPLKENNRSYLRLAVVDQGEGIAAADQQRIFERFTQAASRKGGSSTDTGLGLTFCKLATEAHGGVLQVKSALDSGATFALMLPVTGAQLLS